MADFRLQAPDFSPLWNLVQMKRQDEQMAYERSRQEKADAQSDEMFTLQKRQILQQLGQAEDQKKAEKLAQDYLGYSVGVGTELESLLVTMDPGNEYSGGSAEKLESKLVRASEGLRGTPYEEDFKRLIPFARSGDLEGMMTGLQENMVRAGVFKEYLGYRKGALEVEGMARGETGDESEMQVKIRELSNILVREGVEPTEARRRATEAVIGTSNVQMSQSGQMAATDDLRGTARLITQPANTARPPEIPANETMWEAAGRGTGAGSALKDLWARTGGQIFSGTIDEQTAQDRQNLQSQQTGIIRAFSLNSRYTGPQIDLVREEIAIAPEVFDSPQLMRNRMVSIDRSMSRREEQLIQFLNDSSIPEAQKAEDRVLLREIMNFKEQLGVPAATTVDQLTVQAIDRMSDKELEQAVQWIGPNIRNASNEVKQALIDRRSN